MKTAERMALAGDSRLARARSRARRESGQAFVEFALALPVLMLLIMGIIKVGIVFNNYTSLNSAVKAGARQLSVGRGQNTDVCSQAVNRVRTAASSLDQSKLTVNTPMVSAGACNPGTSMVLGADGTVSADYPCTIKILPYVNIPLTCHASTTERVE